MCVVVREGIARRCETIVAVTQLTALTTVVQLTTVLPQLPLIIRRSAL